MRALAALIIALPLYGCGALPADDTLEIRNATVIDPASGTVTADRCIRISGETITGIVDCARTPDIPVIDDQGELARGTDPQLEAAIAEVMRLIETEPGPAVAPPAFERRVPNGS